MSSKSPITCHVLDSSIGKPAQGIPVHLFAQLQTGPTHQPHNGAAFVQIGGSLTNADGRCLDLLPQPQPQSQPSPSNQGEGKKEEEKEGDPEGEDPRKLRAGRNYQIVFDTKEYFERTGRKSFYPFVQITFTIENPGDHYHVPLLISPFSYTTYRGS